MSEAGSGFGTDTNRVTFLRPNAEPDPLPQLPKSEVARELWNRVVALRQQ